MTHYVLQDLREELFKLEDLTDDIDKWFQTSSSVNQSDFINRLKRVLNSVSSTNYVLSEIEREVNSQVKD